MSFRAVLKEMPEHLRGTWCVLTAEQPDGTRFGPEVLEVWKISASMISSDTADLCVREVQADVEPDQDLHLVSFEGQSLQYAFLHAASAEELLVVAYLGGQERLRYGLAQPPSGLLDS